MGAFLGDDESVQCKVVLNAEEQYSIWPMAQATPPGWKEEGFRGTRHDCLDYIDKIWTDMTPRSLRVDSN